MRRITARRAFQDALISGGSVLVLLMVLVAVDDRVRTEVWRRSTTSPSMELAGAGYQVQHVVHVIAGAVKDQSQTHSSLMAFAVAAGILTLFMLRT
jgi:hypothetical protein